MRSLVIMLAATVVVAFVIVNGYYALTRPCQSRAHRHRHWRRSGRHY